MSGWDGGGNFTRIYSWVADRIAGIDIDSTRMDTDTNAICSAGLGNCLTRDGQGQPTANLPMNGFMHTGCSDGTSYQTYATVGQVQKGTLLSGIAGGAADALTVSLTPSPTLTDGMVIQVRSAAANATTTPTLSVNGNTARTITKAGNQALAAGDIPRAGFEMILKYVAAGPRWELLNPIPSTTIPAGSVGTTQLADGSVTTAKIAAGAVTTATMATNSVTNAVLAQMAANTLKGNNTGGTANAADLTVAQVKTMLGIANAVLGIAAYVVFAGRNTNGACTILASSGVTSVTRNSSGNYSVVIGAVTLTTGTATIQCNAGISGGNAVGFPPDAQMAGSNTYTFLFRSGDGSSTADPVQCSIMIY